MLDASTVTVTCDKGCLLLEHHYNMDANCLQSTLLVL